MSTLPDIKSRTKRQPTSSSTRRDLRLLYWIVNKIHCICLIRIRHGENGEKYKVIGKGFNVYARRRDAYNLTRCSLLIESL